ncbi:MAG TPA: redoxin domain-containing protein [bacterium]|nr:redoxin domain-containing protein [bacterium]
MFKGISITLPIAMFFFLASSTTPSTAEIARGQTITSMPNIIDTDGAVFGTADVKDKTTLLFFFSIYSDSTEELLQYMHKLLIKPEFKDKIQIIGVSIDPTAVSVCEFFKKRKIPFRILLDNSLELSNRFAIKKTPGVFLLDTDRTVQFSKTGFSVENRLALEFKIASVLNPGSSFSQETEYDNEISNEFDEKKLVSANTRVLKFCPVNNSLLFYISNDQILWFFDIDTFSRTELATDIESADWSPDCSRIVFSNLKKQGVWIKELNSPANKISTSGTKPVWSPKGDLIAYVVDENIFVFSIDENRKWQVSAPGIEASWSPSGNLLIITDKKKRAWLVSPFSQASLIQRILR